MNQFYGLLRTLRVRQWTKNGFIFVPLFFDRKLTDPHYLQATIAGFFVLCLASSSVYIMNDLVDIEADRAHPIKRNRPIPSGQLSKLAAIIATFALAAGTMPLAYLLEPEFFLLILLYLALQIAYTFWLKHLIIIDVMAIAAGFVLRVGCGVVLVDVVRFSPWLYVFMIMLSLYLGFGKRRHELTISEEHGFGHRAILSEYNVPLLDELIVIVSATSILTYALYTFIAEGLPPNHTMMLTIPFVLYGIFRYLFLIHVRGAGGAPEDVLLTDLPLQLSVLLGGVAIYIVLYILK